MTTGAASDISLEIKIGQLIMAGIAGMSVGDDGRYLIEELRIGNVILMGRNVESPRQVLTLTTDLQRLALDVIGIPLLIATDQEGGQVQRLNARAGFTPMPNAATVGLCWRPEAIRRYARAVGEELRAVGIHAAFAPVLDVNDNPNNPVIGRLNRSFGPTPRQVERAAIPFLEGLHDAGVMAGGKHFPGHGSTSKDSHYSLPFVVKDREELATTELPPFRQAIDAGIDLLLTAHVTYPALDPSGDPATISAPILGGLLRQALGFAGVIVTDGLEMDGIRKLMPLGEAAVRAVEAGVDVVLCVRQQPARGGAIEEIRAGLLAAAVSGRLSAARIDQSFRRVVELKRSHGVGPATGEGIEKVGGPEHLRAVADLKVAAIGTGTPGKLRSLIWRLRRLARSARGPLD
jgi:beta-N-acetylhexosaminidase